MRRIFDIRWILRGNQIDYLFHFGQRPRDAKEIKVGGAGEGIEGGRMF